MEWMGLKMDRTWKGRGQRKGISGAGTAHASAWRQESAGLVGGTGRQRAGTAEQQRETWETVGGVSKSGFYGTLGPLDVIRNPPKVSMSKFRKCCPLCPHLKYPQCILAYLRL